MSVNLTALTPDQLANFQCTIELCSVKDYGWVEYLPSLPGNILFLVIFAILLPPQLYLGITRRTIGVCIAFTFALIMEILGYAGRIMMHFNPFLKDWFLMYLIDLTIGPTFIAAGIYLCLSRIIVVFDGAEVGGDKVARWKPRTYTLFFLVWDIISLVLQAIGGAIASLGSDKATVDLGTHIMVAGLSVQVASLLLFITICAILAFKWHKKHKRGALNSKHQELYTSTKFKIFLHVLGLATLCIFIRSVFRVAELSKGFGGSLANNEVSFMVLDGTMIIIALIALTVMHPGVAFGNVWQQANFHIRTRKYAGESSGSQSIEGKYPGTDIGVREV